MFLETQLASYSIASCLGAFEALKKVDLGFVSILNWNR